ncbi:MAG: hypothetical protein JWQ81_5901 [Amycolatopsis sp.]|nr:hypothetical protein [Amycolatopsis sp.]MCU1685162.1 hypothetical protein [Amycolatopsis sp.]
MSFAQGLHEFECPPVQVPLHDRAVVRHFRHRFVEVPDDVAGLGQAF